jgi:hypothetical protein
MAGKETMTMATMPEQIEHERLAAHGNGGSGGQRRPPTGEERGRARRERRDDRARERKKRRELAAATIWLPALGVAIRDGNVYAWELSWSGPVTGRLLGPLAWAHAETTGGVPGRARSDNARAADTAPAAGMAGPASLRAGMSRKRYRGVAAVAFPDGNVCKKKLTDATALTKAKAEAVRFNILAVGAAPETRPAGNGVASDLERLAALHTSGILDDEEFRQAKARALTEGR